MWNEGQQVINSRNYKSLCDAFQNFLLFVCIGHSGVHVCPQHGVFTKCFTWGHNLRRE